jgi:hypothetical protein
VQTGVNTQTNSGASGVEGAKKNGIVHLSIII